MKINLRIIDEDVEEKENYINEKLSKLPVHQRIKRIKRTIIGL